MQTSFQTVDGISPAVPPERDVLILELWHSGVSFQIAVPA